MISTIIEMLSYSFIRRAILVGILVSLCAALLGVILVLKRYSMIGDGLSHVGFAFLTIAAAFGLATPLYIAIPGVIIASIVLLKLGDSKKLKSDSSIALISSSALAIGVAIASVTTGMNTDICNFMFGSILAMNGTDVILSVIASVIVVALFFIFYRKIFAVTFDEKHAKASGLKVQRYTNLIAVLTAVVIVIGMRMMGTLLISSIIIFPALTSMRIFKTFKNVIISSAIISVASFLIGLYLSFVLNISAGAMIVIVNLFLFIIFTIIDKVMDKA